MIILLRLFKNDTGFPLSKEIFFINLEYENCI